MDLYIVSGRTALLVALPGALWLPVNQLPESPRITPNIEVVSVLGRSEAGDRLIVPCLEVAFTAVDLRRCAAASTINTVAKRLNRWATKGPLTGWWLAAPVVSKITERQQLIDGLRH
mgnify:CR=1 FL=1